ncbi:unnamed protein product [Rhizoctonia solani]|nr:unnamed protein product [Rhizoctonia solani]
MANSTVKGAIHIHGQNPQFLVEKVIRTRIWESSYWKEECFALTAESVIDKAIELNTIGGVYGNQRPTHFICLLLKLLQIQPEKEILIEYLMVDEFKYLRALAAIKIRLRNMAGYSLTFIDEFVDQLLTEERVCDIILPRMSKREVLEETEGLAPRTSVLLDAMAGKSESDDEGGAKKARKRQAAVPIFQRIFTFRSLLLRTTREAALKTSGIAWKDEASENGRETRKMNMYQSLRDAMSVAMTKDDTAVVFGEDVAFGGVFRCTMGLAEEFGRQRVFNTPLTEQGIAGFAIGLASMGHTAIAEIQFADYIYPAFDQLVNEAAKFRYRSGGRYDSVGHGGLYHSQSPEGFFMGAAGLKVVIPRSPVQAKGLLLAAVRDPNPVIFLEPKILYRSSVEQVPIDDFELPIGKAEVLSKGSDLTLLTYGSPVYTCENAMNLLRDPPPSVAHLIPESVRGASIELIDLRTIMPWDLYTVMESVKKTGRLVIVHEAGKTMGPGAEIAAEITNRCFLNLHAPVKRIAGWDTPVPLVYEKFYIPDALRIIDGIVDTLKY